MTLMLSEADYGELSHRFDASASDDWAKTNGEIHRWLPSLLGKGCTRCCELSPGVWLDFIDKEFAQPWALQVPVHEHVVQFTLLVAGTVDYADIYPTLGEGRSYLSGSGLSRGYVAQYGRSPCLKGINIHLQPEVIEPLLVDQPSSLRRSLLKTDEWKTAWFPRVTPAIQAVVRQMICCPLAGVARRLYLQGKVFELLALQLDAIGTDQGEAKPTPTLKTSTVDCLYQARDVLDIHLEDPPLITELARQVGVSDRTLRRGFRELFGTSVIGYLTQQRLIRAKELLSQGDNTVAEVANKVGYTHLGHFAAAFRKQFGVSPREWIA